MMAMNEEKPQIIFSISYEKLKNLFVQRKYSDVNVIVSDKTFSCHRVILASASDYFSAQFGGMFSDSQSENVNLNVDVISFEKTLTFIYTGELDISRENAYELLSMASFLGIRSMEEICLIFMEKNTPSRCIFECVMFADVMGKSGLLAKTTQHIAENFVTLSKNDLFMRVSYNVLKKIIEHPNLQRVEDLILDFIIRWMNYNKERKCEAANLLKSVQSGSITADYLAKLILHDVKLPRMLIHVIYPVNKTNVTEEFALEDDKWVSKNCYEAKYDEKNITVNGNRFCLSLIGWNRHGEAANKFVVKESADDEWRELKPPPFGATSFQLSAVYNTVYLYKADVMSSRIYNAALYAYCMNNRKSEFLSAYVYDLNKWFSVPQPATENYDSCIASVNNLMFLLGGGNSAQCYDHRAPCWIILPEMGHSHVMGAACSHNEKLYVLGGDTKILEMFDPVAGKWEVLGAMKNYRSSHTLVSHQNRLWAMGRNVNLPVEVYNPEVNNWHEISLSYVGNCHGKIVDGFVI